MNTAIRGPFLGRGLDGPLMDTCPTRPSWLLPHTRPLPHLTVNLHNDVVDGNVDELDKEPNEAHDEKAYCCSKGNLLKLCREKQTTEC